MLAMVGVSRAADLGFAYGTYSGRMQAEAGGLIDEPGTWLAIRRQPDGAWRVAVEYNTGIPPPSQGLRSNHGSLRSRLAPDPDARGLAVVRGAR